MTFRVGISGIGRIGEERLRYAARETLRSRRRIKERQGVPLPATFNV